MPQKKWENNHSKHAEHELLCFKLEGRCLSFFSDKALRDAPKSSASENLGDINSVQRIKKIALNLRCAA
jgi:hypothetical protein